MDDSRFDKGIREKLGEYEAPGFDPAALASLHHQMAAVSLTPWYSTYRTELMVGSAVLLSALLIIWSQWMFTNSGVSTLESEIQALKGQIENMGQLRREIESLRATTPDTIRVVEYQEQTSTVYLSLLRKIDHLETALRTLTEESTRQNEMMLAQLNQQPPAQEVFSSGYSKSFVPMNNRINPRESEIKSQRALSTDFPINPDEPQKDLSIKTIKEIQKHYQKGVGVKVGPALNLSYGSFNPGSDRYNFGGGLLADFIVSPSLSFETGIILSQRHNRISATDLSQPSTFPGSDPSIGALKNVDIDSWVVETPIHIKYRYPVSLKSNWIFGAGYTNMIYTKQLLEYDYQFGSNQAASLNSSIIDKNVKAYPGTLNVSLGFSSELKNKKIVEASIYYRYGLGKVGIEQTVPEFVGVRGAYWFTLK